MASLVLATSAALLAAGCGGGGKKSQTLTKAEYAAKLDSICTATNEAGKKLKLTSIASLATNGDKAKGLLDKMIGDIESLKPPSAVKGSADSFVAGLKKEASDFGDLTQAAKSGDTAKIQKLESKLASEAAATSEDARFVGATGCARLL